VLDEVALLKQALRCARKGLLRYVVLNDAGYVGLLMVDVRCNERNYPGYLVKFKTADGEVRILGDFHRGNQQVTTAIHRLGGKWVIARLGQAFQDLGQDLRGATVEENGSIALHWPGFTAHLPNG
jgi:hypothetical protein